ncbi:monosaccharide-sensing protein 1-like [Leguminivora glycinivorella]|uniref:monosaccharide-sensing protein 1-like n=1 Tax=Leguminivora glycinivorella TaxID=1035111 RepID=UPI00200CCFBC|nr:monosaccharide-sensing protein 1-like [Leguminivora glycinivorella]
MSLLKQTLCTGVVCWLCMSMGVTFTWPSSTLLLFRSENTTLHRPMTEAEQALFGSLSSIGALISTPAAGFLLDIIGRKYTSILFSLMHVICWAMVISSNRVEVILTAIFVSGIGGAAFLVVPVYIAEFCEDSLRGGMTSGAMIFYAVGMIISYAIGGWMDYYPMVYVCVSIAVVGVTLLSLLKETPVFLMMKEREEEARESLAFYRNKKKQSKAITQEIETIRRTLNPDLDSPDTPEEEELKLKPETKRVKTKEKLSIIQFIKKSYSTRRALCVILVLMTASVFQGLVAVQVYAEPLFAEAIPSMSATVSSVLSSIITVVAGLTTAYLTDIAGRKPLMIWSSVASGACCLLLGSQIHMHWAPHSVTAVFIFSFCIVYTLGAGTIPYILSPEVFLPEVRSLVSMLVIEWSWLCNFIILLIFNPLVTAIGLGPVFYIFAVVCFFSAVFTHFFLPETKGLPVDAVQLLFSKKRRPVPTHA